MSVMPPATRRLHVDPSRLRLSGSVLRDTTVEVYEDGRVALIVDGEPLATFRSVSDMLAGLGLAEDDLSPTPT